MHLERYDDGLEVVAPLQDVVADLFDVDVVESGVDFVHHKERGRPKTIFNTKANSMQFTAPRPYSTRKRRGMRENTYAQGRALILSDDTFAVGVEGGGEAEGAGFGGI